MMSWQSIRFRLSVQYSAVVFGLGGALLGLVYWAVRRMLRAQTMTQYVIENEPVIVDGVQVGVVPQLSERELRTLESLFNEHVLNELARYTIFSLVALFMLSLVVGWVMSGRVLKPVEEITTVAREIQASDLSRRIDLEGPDDEIRRLAATFDAMLERLDRAFSSQRRFLADTSHDLRTPLAVIRSNVEVVSSDESASVEEWREVGAIVQRNAEKMSAMIDALLAAARFQIGKAQAVTIDLESLVRAKTVEYEKLADERGVRLESWSSPVSVDGIEVSLDRVLSNLLDNAFAVSQAGSTIRMAAGSETGWAWMAVQDEGPGLAAKAEATGLGLGLSIVAQIAEAHGGALTPHGGRDGSGTTMVVWLPTSGAGSSHPNSSPLTGV